jgi:hypothetical protein
MVVPHLMQVAAQEDGVVGTLRVKALIRVGGEGEHAIFLPPLAVSLRYNVGVFIGYKRGCHSASEVALSDIVYRARFDGSMIVGP